MTEDRLAEIEAKLRALNGPHLGHVRELKALLEWREAALPDTRWLITRVETLEAELKAARTYAGRHCGGCPDCMGSPPDD